MIHLIDLSRAKLAPYSHQVQGIEELVRLDDPKRGRIIPGAFLLADDMGAGKTKQVLDAAQILYVAGSIDRLVVVCPAGVRSVWFDPELGEIKKHGWDDLPILVTELHGAKLRQWGSPAKNALRIVVTNYEGMRMRDKKPGPLLAKLLPYCTTHTWLVLDESYNVKSHKSLQTKGVAMLRKRCGRVTLLNGLPISNSPADIFSQANLMDPRILDCKSYSHFRNRYGVMGGFMRKQVIGWKHAWRPSPSYDGILNLKAACCDVDNPMAEVHRWDGLGDIQKRLTPYTLRRMKSDCMDLPSKLPPVTFTVPLSATSWALYKQMRDDLMAELDDGTVSLAKHAAVKAVRLGQITSGLLGGIQESRPCECATEDGGASTDCRECGGSGIVFVDLPKRLTGVEKRDVAVGWARDLLEAEPNAKLVIWSRFRQEAQQIADDLGAFMEVGTILGGDPKGQAIAKRMLDPRTCPAGPAGVVGITSAGSVGLNLTAARWMLYASNGHSLFHRLQSEDRIHRGGQTGDCWYGDVVATGPDGQRTVDHAVIKALRAKQDVAEWTTAAWRRVLGEE